MGWLVHVLGIDDETGRWYAFWSGFGGDVAILGGILAQPVIYLRHHNCHTARCWRPGHPVAGIVACRKHREALRVLA